VFTLTASLIVLMTVAWPGQTRAQDPSESSEVPLIPIGQSLTDRDGDTVPDLMGRTIHVRGVVTVPTGVISDAYLQAFIQDETGGIFIFDRKIERDLDVGDFVDVVGQIDQYRGAIQIINPVYDVIGKRDIPPPRSVSVSEAASWQQYGQLVRVSGILGESESQTTILIPLRAEPGEPAGKIDVFIPRKVDRGMLDEDHPPGATVSLVGVVSIRAFDRPYLDGFQVILSKPSDLEVLERPAPPWVRDVIIGLVVAALIATLVVIGYLAYRSRIEKRERQLSLVNDLSTIIASPHLDREQLLDSSTKMIRERTGARAVAIQLLSAHGDLNLSRWEGLPQDDADALREETLSNDQEVPARTAAISRLESRGYHLVTRLPISGRNRSIGVLSVFSASRVSSPETVAILSTAAGIIGVGLENAAMARESEEREAELKQLAITDELTGLYNRRFLDEYLRIQLAMAHRQREPIAFITLDLDRFKDVNDRHGHEVGDRVLARAGEIIRLAVRASDLPVRMGGEEFLIVMPQTDADGATTFASRLIEMIAETDFSHLDVAAELRITASAGVSAFPEHGDRIRSLLRKADEALYVAKSDGRNAVRLAQT
jgi:diguanylate cyclase (GGDEF)-like protein